MTSAFVIVDSSAYEGDKVLGVCMTEQEARAVIATWPDYVTGGAVREVPLVRLVFDDWSDEPKDNVVDVLPGTVHVGQADGSWQRYEPSGKPTDKEPLSVTQARVEGEIRDALNWAGD